MPTRADLTALEKARAQASKLDQRRRALDVRLRLAQADRERLVSSGAAPAVVTAAATRVAQLAAQQAEAALVHREALARARDLRALTALLDPPEAAIGSLDGQVPIALLPVRIETRFADAGRTLHIRVFPDQIHVDAHEPELTEEEISAGHRYWEQRWPAPANADEAHAAWTAIATAMRPTRARWVVEATRPTNGPGLPPGPVFPAVTRRPAAWTRPGRAKGLPARWVAIGQRGGRELFRVWSAPVPDDLEVTPAPEDETAMSDTAVLGEGLRWLSDPDAAREAGMWLTVHDTDLAHGAHLRDGLDQLVVLGVDWTKSPDESAGEFAGLLAAHLYGDGFSFVAQGTPTNNTASVASGATSDRSAIADTLDPARVDPTDPAWSAGPRLAVAIGLGDAGAAALSAAPGWSSAEHRVASALLDATWEATAGTYLGQMLRPPGGRMPFITDEEIDNLRAWAAAHVFAAGPLPTIRVGPQPYGLLPVVDPSRYQPRSADRTAGLVSSTTTKLRRWWEQGSRSVPRLDRADDLDATLVDLLQRSPVAATARFRRVLPAVTTANLTGLDDLTVQQGFQTWLVSSMYEGLFSQTPPRIGTFTTDPRHHSLRIPWARPPGLEAGAALPYIADLRDLLGVADSRDRLATRAGTTNLAEALLALSAALELDTAHGRIVRAFADRQGLSTSLATSVRVRHPDSIAIGTERTPQAGALAFASPKALSDAVIPGLTGSRTVAAHVRSELAGILAGAGTRPGLDGMRRFVDALDRLRSEPGERVEWMLRGLLDLYTYRLDAWCTSLATERLIDVRRTRPNGVYIGCFGWVESLRPDPPGRDSLGYVHTPSVAHAVAAAVLRSGHLAHRDSAQQALAVDLSSRRVRGAMSVLDGIETGQPLGALLGYRIERALRDRDPVLTQYVLPLRRLAPLRHTDTDPEEPLESIAARDVVDAVALLDRWRAAGGRDAVLAGANVQARHRVAVSAVLDAIDDVLDAVADVLLSEVVYQTVRGNQERAGAALAALDRQERPVRPEVVATPRSGTTVAHRVVVILRGDVATGWEALADDRGAAEPRLNAWSARLLGPPDGIVFAGEVRRGDVARATVSATATELGLSPLALLLAARRVAADQPSELESRVARALATKVAGAQEDDRLVLLPEPPPGARTGAWGLASIRTVATWFARVVAGRPASGRSLGPQLNDQSDGYVLAELAGRADRAVTALAATASALDGAMSAPRQVAIAALARGARLGITDALPDGPAAATDAAMRDQVSRVRAIVAAAQARLDTARAAFRSLPRPTSDQVLDFHRKRLGIIFGENFPAVPQFRVASPGAVVASAADRAALLAGDDISPLAWLHRSALVRPAVDPLSSLLSVAEANGREVGLPRLDVVQAPHAPGERWVALPPRPDEAMPSGRVGIVIHAPDGFDPTQPAAGLVVDEWTETIPATTETTALSFHYDAPAARPPQAVVLAVTGVPDAASWSFDELLGTVGETMALARLRAVGPRDLPDLGGYLPALYVPQDVTGDVPGIDLRDLADRAQLADVVPNVLGKS